MGALYILKSPSGKQYVGITTRLVLERFNSHCVKAFSSGSDLLLHRAIRKYGRESFGVTTLAISDSWEYLCFLEKSAITAFKTLAPNGYNATLGGEGTVGLSFSKERKVRQCLAIKKALSDPIVKERHRQSKIVECNTVQGRSRLSEVARRPEVRLKKSVAIKKFWAENEDAKNARNLAIKKSSNTLESKARRSLAGKRSSTPEVCALRSYLAKNRRWMHKAGVLKNAALELIPNLLIAGWNFGKIKPTVKGNSENGY